MSLPSSPRRSLSRGAAVALLIATLAVVAGLFAGAASAQAADTESGRGRHPVRHWVRSLTDDQRQCLQDQGVERPARGQRPTQDDIDTFRAALDACDIDVPPALDRLEARMQVRAWVRGLTDEQRQCLHDHGVHRPAHHHRPTQDQLQALRDAAAACDIDLPAPLQGP